MVDKKVKDIHQCPSRQDTKYSTGAGRIRKTTRVSHWPGRMATVSFADSPFANVPDKSLSTLTTEKPCVSPCPVLPHLPYQQRSTGTNPICSIDSPLVEAAAHAGRSRLKSDATSVGFNAQRFRHMATHQSCISPRGASSRCGLARSHFATIGMHHCISYLSAHRPICF
ncbi:hypothetical protein LX32DRAFT_132859 [Colletotrichum zoysiae]|uniref:Uncharacterized protein n=1 Tax=Colletotrichum zoysiae TaxID=1216348 RepID=A0AAD9LZG3_9PEZI|nr:hypothetical protein LX32DRAFT_132859 [Colletotrichum zoysiae]